MTMQQSYLFRLTERISAGLRFYSENWRVRHSNYLTSLQLQAGGFPDREGGADLYYTGFALRGLASIGGLNESMARRCAAYLRSCIEEPTNIVDFVSLLYAAGLVGAYGAPQILGKGRAEWTQQAAEVFEQFRKEDGGYAKSTQGLNGSTYHTFLVALCFQMLGQEFPRRDATIEFILSRQRDEGGFVEIRQQKRGGTNPTAAATSLLMLLDYREPTVMARAAEFLAARQNSEGGLCANTLHPMADLLSTFSGLLTLTDLNEAGRLDRDALRRYVETLEVHTGGYRGGAWDNATDAEYTFYGLGTLALLAGT